MSKEVSPDEAVAFVKQVTNLLAINQPSTIVGQHRLNLLDSMRLVPTYSGDEASLTLEKFWEIFQSNASYFNWGDEDQLFALNNKLTGKALALVEIHRQPNSTVEDIIQILRERFSVKKLESEILSEFFSFKQPDFMSVVDYIAEAKKRVTKVSKVLDISEDKRAESEEKWVKNMLLKNLNDNIRRGVIARSPLTLKDLEAAARSEELAWKATNAATTFTGATSNLNPFAQEFAAVADIKQNSRDSDINDLKEIVKNLSLTVESMSCQMQQLTKNQYVNQNPTRKSVRSQIPANADNLVCFGCGQLGHFKRECPFRGPRNPPSSTIRNIPNSGVQTQSRGNFQHTNYSRGHQQTQNFHMGGTRDYNQNQGNYRNSRDNFQDRRGESYGRGRLNREGFNRNTDRRDNLQSRVDRPSGTEETKPKTLNF